MCPNKARVDAIRDFWERKICSIVGPPGTGKTSAAALLFLSITIVERYMFKEDQKHLLSGASSTSVKHTMRKCTTMGFNLARLGSGEGEQNIHDDLQ